MSNVPKPIIFNSSTQLSSYYIDIINTFILPFISLIGIMTNLICIIVLKNLKTGVNQYLLLFSISDFLFSLVCLLIGFIRCGSFCSFGYSYGSKLIELYIYIFITNSCIVFSLLIDLDVTIKKLKLFSIKYRNQIKVFLIKDNKLRIFLHASISLLINIFIYFIPRQVNMFGYLKYDNSTNIEVLYTVSNTVIGNDKTVQNFVLSLTILRGFFLIILLLIINFTVLFKYKQYIFLKQSLIGKSILIFDFILI